MTRHASLTPRRGAGHRPPARGVRAWVATALLAVTATAASAGFVALDLAQRLAAAESIAVGVIRGVDVVVRDGEPWTLVTMEVERWWVAGGTRVTATAGDETAALPDALTAAFWGGRAPGAPPLQVAGVPSFGLGERVLWLLRAADDGLGAPTVGVTQGVWRWTAGVWRGDDGSVLGVDDDGDLALDAQAAPDEVLFAALDAALAALEPRP
ncbi:MAG: hypothetical protein K0A98_12505 [Trueperaceae bacterium]|nr:hypothetical protein [Trueperaceae bacterium]